MMRPRDEKPTLLLLGYGERYPALSGRILLLQFRTLRAESVTEAVACMRESAEPVRAVLVTVPPPFHDPARDVASLREAGGEDAPQLVVVGPRPDASGVDRLRKAGLRFACFEPWTDSELRFILNRVIYDPARARIKVRDGLRVPTNLMGRVFGSAGEKPVLVYNVSMGGAYLETHRPNPTGALVEVELPLESQTLRIQARVISTNVPGNLRRPNLPLGMGVRFESLGDEATQALEAYISERAGYFDL
jgi:hypothetical protein